VPALTERYVTCQALIEVRLALRLVFTLFCVEMIEYRECSSVVSVPSTALWRRTAICSALERVAEEVAHIVVVRGGSGAWGRAAWRGTTSGSHAWRRTAWVHTWRWATWSRTWRRSVLHWAHVRVHAGGRSARNTVGRHLVGAWARARSWLHVRLRVGVVVLLRLLTRTTLTGNLSLLSSQSIFSQLFSELTIIHGGCRRNTIKRISRVRQFTYSGSL
jgi:hypothetical protein